MSTSADTGTADITGTRDDRATPARLRRLPSRLLTQTAMHADRLVNEGLARADDRKWHYAVLAALQEFGPASQAALSRRTGIYRSDLVAVINELAGRGLRSEEYTSELQSHHDLVCRLLLEKKKRNKLMSTLKKIT